jgi:hypothetical protein
MSLPARPRRLLMVACAAAIFGAGGCTTLHGLNVVDTVTSDPAQSAAENHTADIMRAFARAKESLIVAQPAPEAIGPAQLIPAGQDVSAPGVCQSIQGSVRSVLKQRTSARRAAFTAAQIEAAPPPAALDRQPQPELLPIGPPRSEPSPLAAGMQEPREGQPSTQQRIKSILEISLDIRPPQIFNDQREAMAPPLDVAQTALPQLAQAEPFTRGDLAQSGYHWQPTPEGLWFCYQPLYFQEVNVERYGRSFGIFQPAVSVASFYGRVPLLPYMVFARPARQCTCPPHWTLPGYRIPEWERHEFVPSISGAAAESAAIYGLILLIP